MEIYQPKNREESLAILEEYKNQLTQEQYRNIKETVCSFAIESMFADREDIENCIKIATGQATVEEISEQMLERLKQEQLNKKVS
ncbi:MAG: hypothetical protein LBG67_01515 [Campylobacteraceae bacterium]|jgi:hypothetical protein|nr:hypothetical protein [Campylobacteraceae bacterium]